MSATAGLWVAMALLLVPLSFLRPVWAIAFYMLTFFAAPQMWWWGSELPVLRYALIAGLVLLVAVALYRPVNRGHRVTMVHWAALGMVVNATLVHFVISPTPDVSFPSYLEVVKFVLLFFLIWQAIQDKSDFRIALIAIALGAAYIGYEVTINERGSFSGSRLEGVGAPGADSANSLASLMLITLPLTGSLFVDSRLWHKLVVMVSAPLALNVLLLCNSRGAFLGLMGAGLSFVLIARGATRKRAMQTLALGAVALYLLLGDARILDRFTTTFSGSEDRDRSAASRIEFWQAGLLMLADYPLGAGGSAFKNVHGARYLSQVAGIDQDRSLHNGYLTEATSWGIQGLTLHLLLLGGALVAAYRTSERCRKAAQPDNALIGICMIVAATALLIHSFFGSFLGNEWGFWIAALLLRYSEIYRPAEAVQVSVPEQAAA